MRSLFVGDGFINLDVALGYICNTASIIGAHQTIVGIPTSHSFKQLFYTISSSSKKKETSQKSIFLTFEGEGKKKEKRDHCV